MIFSGKDFHVYHLGSVAVSYPPRGINTYAIQVTPENIGALSLEFKVGLHYNKDGNPYFKILAQRENVVGGPINSAELMIFADDWIIVLWDELHVFQDLEFKNTFRITAVETPSSEKKYLPGAEYVSDLDLSERPVPDSFGAPEEN